MMMDKSMWIATIFGPYLVIMGVWMLFYADHVVKMGASMKTTPALLYLAAAFNLLVGLFILREYHEWVKSLSVLVTVLGWLMVLRGFFMLFIPGAMMKATTKKRTTAQFAGLVILIGGVLLCWLGYFS
jgi:hypothetical protein